MNSTERKRSWWRCLIEFEKSAMTQSDWQRQRHFLYFCARWAVCYVASNWLLKSSHSLSSWQLVITISLPVIIGGFAIWSYTSFLRKADELILKVHYEGISIGFGVGLLYSVAYQLILNAGFETGDYSISVMSIGWALGVLRASWKFQ